MATYLEYLSFKASLPWYKKILFPLFLNKAEHSEYDRLVNEDKSELDIARDRYFFAWNEHNKKPTPQTKDLLTYWEKEIQRLLRKEFQEKYYEDNHTGRDN